MLPKQILDEIEHLEPTLRKPMISILENFTNFISELHKEREISRLEKLIEQTNLNIRELQEFQKKFFSDFIDLKKLTQELQETQKQLSSDFIDLKKLTQELQETQKQLSSDFIDLKKLTQELQETQKQLSSDFIDLKKLTQELQETQKQLSSDFIDLKKLTQELQEMQKQDREEIKIIKNKISSIEETLQEIARLQKQNEKEIAKLAREHQKTREELGGLSHTVGYHLENESYKYLPELLKRDFGIQVLDKLTRDFILLYGKTYEEINIIGKIIHEGKTKILLGEAKTKLKPSYIDKFLIKVKKLEYVIKEEKFLVLVTHQAHPITREYAKQKGIHLYFSYEFSK